MDQINQMNQCERDLYMYETISLNSFTSEIADIALRSSWFILISFDAYGGGAGFGVNLDADISINAFISFRSVTMSSVREQANQHKLTAKHIVGITHMMPMTADA